jgi:HlyD family secretion protein
MYLKAEHGGPTVRLGQPMMFHGPSNRTAQAGTGTKGGLVTRQREHLWVLENGQPKPIPVKVGLSDGQYTEVSGADLREGMDVLVGVESPKASGAGPGRRN